MGAANNKSSENSENSKALPKNPNVIPEQPQFIETPLDQNKAKDSGNLADVSDKINTIIKETPHTVTKTCIACNQSFVVSTEDAQTST